MQELKSTNCSLKLLKQKCKSLKILYVEDDEKVRLQTKKMLGLFFNHIDEANDGKEALNLFKQNSYNIIFTDISMSQMDGLTMIKHIRALNEQIPIIIFSAYDNTEYFLQAIDFGVDGYILKPFNFDDIQKIIQKVIHKLYNTQNYYEAIELCDCFSWDMQNHTLYKNDEEMKLTKNETTLLALLSSSKDAVFTSQEIEVELFDDDYSDNKRVRSLISRLKTKLDANLIISIYGQGYKLNRDKKC